MIKYQITKSNLFWTNNYILNWWDF